MKLKVYKALWGMDGSLEEKISKIAAAGYDGIETRVPADLDPKYVKKLLKDAGLEYIPMVFTEDDDHVESLRTQVEHALEFEPRQINSHSGRDFWSLDQSRAFFAKALEIERKAGCEINHETHRGRIFFNPWITADLLKEFPDLYITADFSHFVCVCERLLADASLKPAMDLCIARSRHIHGRIGYEEGPQVNDPRAPEWSEQVKSHEAWWESISRKRHEASAEFLTFDPEFGPPNYMHTSPYSQEPTADLWDVCLHVANQFRKQYKGLFPEN